METFFLSIKKFFTQTLFLHRRKFVFKLSSLIGFVIVFNNSCENEEEEKEEEEKGKVTKKKAIDSREKGPLDPNQKRNIRQGNAEIQDPNFSVSDSKCNLDKNVSVDLSQIPLAKEEFFAKCKLLGSSSSSLVVLEFPFYQDRTMKEIFLLYSSGQLIAQKSIMMSSDIKKNGKLRLQLFDNLTIDPEQKSCLWYKLSNRSFYKFYFKESPQFETSFRGRKIVGQNSFSVPVNFYDYQAFPFLDPKIDFTLPEDKSPLINSSLVVKFNPNNFLEGYIVTDLIGNTLNVNSDEEFDFRNYQEFLCYKFFSDGYYRTLVRTI